MKRQIIAGLVILSISGCKQTPELKLADLKFGDVEREQLAANKISAMTLVSKKEFFYSPTDTIGYCSYDEAGRLLIESRPHIFGGHTARYLYDTNGFVVHKRYTTDFNAVFQVTYRFLPGRLLLYQYWTGLDSATSVFKFGPEGRLMKSTDYENEGTGRGYKSESSYEYSPSGKLMKRTTDVFDDINEFHMSTDVTDYYYTNQKLDSTITEVKYLRDSYRYPRGKRSNYRSKTYYTSEGLRARTVERDTVVIYYKYKARTI